MRYPWFRLAIFIVGCLFPVWWLYEAAMNLLGPDPGKIMMDRLGLGALTFLLVTLSMTPLQKLTGQPWEAPAQQQVSAIPSTQPQ